MSDNLYSDARKAARSDLAYHRKMTGMDDNLPPLPDSGIRLLDGTIVYTATIVRTYVAAAASAERERCAVIAWNHYMDTCKRMKVPAASFEHWCAAAAIRGKT